MMHPTPEQISYMKEHVGDDRRAWFVGANVACLAVAYLSVALRFASRLKIGTRLGLDDWLICFAAVLLTGHVSCLLATVKLGMGRHIILMTDPKKFVIVTLTAQTFYNLCIPFVKLSILCLYGRIFHRTTGWLTPTLWLSALFVFLYTVPQCFAYLFQCVPIESLWTDFGPGLTVVCINFKAAIIAFGTINIVTDWFILALPVPVVLGLQLDKRTKWSVCSLFLIGGFVCVISIIRLMYAKQVETADPTWDYVPISLISTLECSVGILAACMPTWRPLFRFLGRGITAYFSNSRSVSSGDPNMHYGNNIDIGRGGWRARSRGNSRSRSRKAAENQNHASGVRAVFSMSGGKRSETSMSGDSVEKILKDKGAAQAWTNEVDIELNDTTITPFNNPTTPSPNMRTDTPSSLDGPTRSKSASPRGTVDVDISTAAGGDRWESIKNVPSERGRKRVVSPGPGRAYGDVAFGSRKLRRKESEESGGNASEAKKGEKTNGGKGLGMDLGGIVVTRTVTRSEEER